MTSSTCAEHITDSYLKEALRDFVTERACTLCGRTTQRGKPFAVPIESLVEVVNAAINRHYGSADDEGAPWDNEDGYMVPTYDIREVVSSICDGAFDENHETVLYDAIVESIGWDLVYVDAGPVSQDSLDWGWEEFAKTVRTTSRFIIARPGSEERDTEAQPRLGRDRRKDPPHRLGEFLRLLLTYVDGQNSLTIDLPVGTAFYRGRLMPEPHSLKPTVENLRPAPPHRASANRMSPAGISMFYAGAEPETAIAEIASHGPEPYAMTGTFRNTRPLSVLDFTAAVKWPSVFDERRHAELAMAQFRRSFVAAITAPIIPDGRQHIEYTPTQVITEYLRWAPERIIDGILLPSAQGKTGGKTYVLFFSASDCADEDEEANQKEVDSAQPRWWLGPRDVPSLLLSKDEIQVWEVDRQYAIRKYGSPFT